MRPPRSLRPVLAWLLALCGLHSCYKGEGSFVPPFLPRTPEAWLAGVVLDQESKPIVSARITVAGSSTATGRNGRFYLEMPPIGPQLLRIDGTNGTADAGDRFPYLMLRHDVAGGKAELSRPVVLPDLGTGTGSTLALGSPLAAPVTVDASSTAGGRLLLSAGVLLTQGASTGTVDLNLCSTEVSQAPLDLPASGSGVRIATRILWVTPVDLGFAGGSRDIELANDLGLPATTVVELYRLDPVSGAWNLVGAGTVQAGGATIATTSGAIAGGGLYTFASSVTTSTSVSGRVFDETGHGLPFARIYAQEAPVAACDAQGNFVVPSVAAVDGAGSPRALRVRAMAPIGWAPATAVQNVAALPGTSDAGTLGLAAFRASGVRVLSVSEGQPLPDRRFRAGVGAMGFSSLAGSDGVLSRRDLPLGWGRTWTGYGQDDQLYRTPDDLVRESTGEYDYDDFEAYVRTWDPRDLEAKNQNFLLVVDAEFGGPIEGARVQANTSPGSRSDPTEEFGTLLFDNERFGDQTASYESTAPDGSKVTSALTLAHIDNGRVEYPLQIARRKALGAYEPFGLIQGSLTGAVSGKVRRLRVEPLRYDNDWFDLVLGGPSYVEDLPRLVDPDVAGTDYLVGLPPGRATMIVTEGTVGGGAFIPERLGLLEGLVPVAGGRLVQDLDLAWPVDATLTVTGLAAGLDPAFVLTDLSYRLALSDTAGHAVEVLPESGAVSAAGADLVFPVPTLTGSLSGRSRLLWTAATRTAAGVTERQEVLLSATGTTATNAGFHPLPRITAPGPGATVAKDGFSVTWTADPTADWLELELQAVDGSDDRYWSLVLPADRTSQDFGQLVSSASQVLVGGRTWTLTLRSIHIDRGYLLGRSDVYQAALGCRFSIPAGHMGIQSRSSTGITIQTAP